MYAVPTEKSRYVGTRYIGIHAAASAEAEAALEWYSARSAFAAFAFLLELNHAVTSVSETPQRWPRHEKNIRKYVFPKFPFVLYYQLTEQKIQIIAVAHSKRRPDYWKNR